MSCVKLLTVCCFAAVSLMRAQTNESLVEARSHFTTKLLIKGAAPQEYESTIPPSDFDEVFYPSGKLKLKAWLSKKPNDNERHPAVIFLHGGFSFGAEDWQDAALFQKAGFVVMSPMLRGENGNPGVFEMLYGEVDDAIAAGKFLKELSYVNSNNVFVAGHSVGGTLVQLVSMTSDEFRAAASFSGSPDLRVFCKGREGIVPFNLTAATEIRLRSPIEFPSSVRVRLFLYAGQEEAKYVKDNHLLASYAKAYGRPATFSEFPGDHFTALKPEIDDAVTQFRLLLVKPDQSPNPSK